jgi:hypothetical protein
MPRRPHRHSDVVAVDAMRAGVHDLRLKGQVRCL